jgi:hypothetical protein
MYQYNDRLTQLSTKYKYIFGFGYNLVLMKCCASIYFGYNVSTLIWVIIRPT